MLELFRDYKTLLWCLTAASLVIFIGTILIVPLLVARIPADYFQRDRRDARRVKILHPVVWLALMLIKNALGIVFIATGVVLLFVPGQGIITILIGITLMNFPGKRALERWIIQRRPVHRAVNWLRRRFHQGPLEL